MNESGFAKNRASNYAVSILLFLAAAWGVVSGRRLWAIAAAALGGLSAYSVGTLLRRIESAEKQRKSLDQQLLQAQKLAAIGELSAGIAHEINNPLAIMSQELEWIRHVMASEESLRSSGFEELNDSLHEIARQVERCKEVTHKLLGFARKMDPVIQPVDINRLIEEMACLVEKEARLRKITLIRRYREDLPPIRTDPPLVRQVVLNLLNNAMHAIGEDGSISLETHFMGDHVELVVSDTGCGIPEELQSRIFDPFFTTKPPGKGTGLGLSICHGIVQRLGGRIELESLPGEGTSFHVILPVREEE
ncbi:MAG: ATP-binding protein [Thermodesulfobacteriota bacterium]|nr:ATP-binding protein [Thermodesulfobacteriota bacterium]